MAGQRHKDFRSGDLNEELGILLLKGLCAVAAVGRPDDVGIDAICTLLREAEDDILVAENTFYVQFKSMSVDPLEYVAHEVKWLKELELPFFIGSVAPETSSIALYPMHKLNTMFLHELPAKMHIFFEKDPAKSKKDGLLVHPGEPLLRWSVQDFRNKDFLSHAYAVLKRYLILERRNVHLRSMRFVEHLTWRTGSHTATNGYSYALSNINQEGEHNALRSMIPFVKMLATEAITQKDKGRLDFIVGLMSYMRARGIDPDLDNIQHNIHAKWGEMFPAQAGQ